MFKKHINRFTIGEIMKVELFYKGESIGFHEIPECCDGEEIIRCPSSVFPDGTISNFMRERFNPLFTKDGNAYRHSGWEGRDEME